MMTARNVVMPALAIAGPRSTRALLVLLNLDPVNETIKFSVGDGSGVDGSYLNLNVIKAVCLSTKVWETWI